MIKRIAEVEIDLLKYYRNVVIKVLSTWQHRGNVELYFKHRYQKFNYSIGSLTEYYKFDNEEIKIVLSDLEQMQPKSLSQVEIDILEENSSLIKIAV